MLEVLLDVIIDSLKVFGVTFIIYIILSFFEVKIAKGLEKKNRFSPLIGSALGIVPQCGLSVVATDMYQKEHITMGTLLAVFISCSDEALPILLSSGEKALSVLPIILIKLVLGFVVGYSIDKLYHKSTKSVDDHIEECHHHLEEEVHIGCCNHHIENDKESSVLYNHFFHPLLHSAKLFIYVFLINLIFGSVIFYIGEETLEAFLTANKYLSPLLSTIIGVIPNCAASVIVTKVYLLNGISFGACVAGLIMNAGLGLLYLFRKKEHIKNNLLILGIMLLVSISVGYILCLILGF